MTIRREPWQDEPDDYDEGMQDHYAQRDADRRYCHVCQSRGGHTDGCPETPDDDDELDDDVAEEVAE